MAEEILNESLPELKELESKVGRKTPESLLVWMKDAAGCDDGRRSDVVDGGDRSSAFSDSLSDKISKLKPEMRRLRSADVRILRQLVAVHEGIEAMRWLMEEQGALASRCSSLSNLATVEEHGPLMCPCRESQSPTPDLTETTDEESQDHVDILSPRSTEPRPSRPSTAKLEVPHSSHGRDSQASSPANGLVSANLPKSQPQALDVALLHNIKAGANTIRRVLLRSSRARREGKADAGIFALTKQSGETQTEHQAQESFRATPNNTMKEEENAPNRETSLLGYDAQRCWVESQEDVTFL